MGPRHATGAIGIDRGFIYFEDSGAPWRGMTSIIEDEDAPTMVAYYVDGKKVGHRYIPGEFAITATSYDDPFGEILEDPDDLFSLTYRETYTVDGSEYYRIHLAHNLSGALQSVTKNTLNSGPEPYTYGWDIFSVPGVLGFEIFGSHLILDSYTIYPWVLRDIETILYGYPDQPPRIPSVDEIKDIFATMNLEIIDHGDGTWSAIGHNTMVGMIDTTEFQITSPTVEMVEGEPHTYTVESMIRDENGQSN